MNDELTPEEKEALAKLPRERMPVGLEGRVVDAMRDHGFLAKRRRSIVLTNTRVAGVLAAGVAIVIGAYSVGLHRGDNEESRRLMSEMGVPAPASEVPLEYDERATAPAPAADAVAPKSKNSELKDAPKNEALQKERVQTNETPATIETQASEGVASAPAQREDETKKDLDWQLKPNEEERAEAKSSDAPTATTPELGRSSGALAPSTMAFSESVQRPLTFHLGGKTVVIEAPDIVRVVEDEPGKTLLIYTSDGLIRIRVTD
jgi:hypothetical protein